MGSIQQSTIEKMVKAPYSNQTILIISNLLETGWSLSPILLICILVEMVCKKRPFALQTRRVIRSPFRTTQKARQAERQYLAKKSIGFTARSSLKAMGRIPRSDGCYLLGPKYRV